MSEAAVGVVCHAGRFQLQKVGAVCRGGMHLGSLYLRDMIGPSDPRNLEILGVVAQKLKVIAGPWIIGGDFNTSPEELAATGFLQLASGTVHCAQDPTCGSKVYDYFIVSNCLSPFVFAVHAIVDGTFSPHCPVRLLLRALPRFMRTRQLVAPRGFAAALPMGPPTQHELQVACESGSGIAAGQTTTALSVHAEFPKLLKAVEWQLSAISGHNCEEAGKHAGRCKAPRMA